MIKSKHKQADFNLNYIRWALAIGIFAGFALGAHVASVIGFDFPIGKTFQCYIQIHGLIQLVGWAGFFIIGISLHFIPRLAGLPIFNHKLIKTILNLIAFGLVTRFLSHACLPYFLENRFYPHVAIIAITGTIAVCSGILIYVLTILQNLKTVRDTNKRPALKSVQLFFMLMLAGWLIYPTINLWLLIAMFLQKSAELNPSWNELSVQLFIHLILLPVAFAFSVRMFPLYLRLPAINWPVQFFAMGYLLAAAMQLLPTIPAVLQMPSVLPLQISHFGMALKGALILWFIWKLDLLTKRCSPWTVNRIAAPGPDRKPTRAGIPDYGEFGRFEWLVYSAYAWLALAAIVEIILGAAFLVGSEIPISTDALRHIYLMGFITPLILGMSVRMIPGFIHKRKVAKPGYVVLTFWLINLAAVARVFPLLIPAALLSKSLVAASISQSLFGLSGIFAMIAVGFLEVNLRKTVKENVG